jgi:hypothetical protein
MHCVRYFYAAKISWADRHFCDNLDRCSGRLRTSHLRRVRDNCFYDDSPAGRFSTGPRPISLTVAMDNSLRILPRASTFARSRNAARGKRAILFGYAADKTSEYLFAVMLAYRQAYCNRALALVYCSGFLPLLPSLLASQNPV